MDFGKVLIGDDLVYWSGLPWHGWGPLIRVFRCDRPLVWGFVVDPMSSATSRGDEFSALARYLYLPKDVPEGTRSLIG